MNLAECAAHLLISFLGTSAKSSPRQQQVQNFSQLVIKFRVRVRTFACQVHKFPHMGKLMHLIPFLILQSTVFTQICNVNMKCTLAKSIASSVFNRSHLSVCSLIIDCSLTNMERPNFDILISKGKCC